MCKVCIGLFVVKQKTAYEMRIRDWSSDVCSSDLTMLAQIIRLVEEAQGSKLPIQLLVDQVTAWFVPAVMAIAAATFAVWALFGPEPAYTFAMVNAVAVLIIACPCARSEEHTSELQSLMRTSYAVFCLQKKK